MRTPHYDGSSFADLFSARALLGLFCSLFLVLASAFLIDLIYFIVSYSVNLSSFGFYGISISRILIQCLVEDIFRILAILILYIFVVKNLFFSSVFIYTVAIWIFETLFLFYNLIEVRVFLSSGFDFCVSLFLISILLLIKFLAHFFIGFIEFDSYLKKRYHILFFIISVHAIHNIGYLMIPRMIRLLGLSNTQNLNSEFILSVIIGTVFLVFVYFMHIFLNRRERFIGNKSIDRSDLD